MTPRRPPGAWAGRQAAAQRAGTRARPRPRTRRSPSSPSSASGCHCTPSTKRRAVGQLDRLGQVVQGRDAADDQPLAEPVDALVVVGLGRVRDLARRRARPASPRSGMTSWSAPSKEPTTRRCSPWPKRLGQVLHQRAAAGDVDQLHAPADAEHRQVALDRRAGQRDLERVALGHRVDGLRVRPLAVAGRVDVGAAGEHQPVDQRRAPPRDPRPGARSGGSISASPPARCTAST